MTLSFAAVNATTHTAELMWCDGDNETRYATLEAGATITQQSFAGHSWRLRCESNFAELVLVAGEVPQRLVLRDAETEEHKKKRVDDEYAASFYKQSIGVGIAGLQVKAAECCAAGAVVAAAEIARQMLSHSSAELTGRLEAQSCALAVIGKGQVTSDIPEHREWALTASRPADAEVRAAADAAAREGDDIKEQRVAMARALLPRLAALETFELTNLVCALVEHGACSDAAVLRVLAAVTTAETSGKDAAAPAAADASAADASAADIRLSLSSWHGFCH